MKSPGDKLEKFPEYGSDYSFSAFEEKILAYWQAGKVFERSLEKAKSRPQYYFYDGPPFATGLPHYGHLIGGAMKDAVPRYWSMRGYSVPRRFGWDTHGLPVEFEMEKKLDLSGSLAIKAYGIAKFNEACRDIVLRYTGEWRKTVERMGRWVDMDNDYKTMDPTFMESVWWVFRELWDKGLIYEGKKVVPYSWRLTAPLSNFEASQNYKDVQDPAITVLLPLKSGPAAWTGNTALTIWTTTPWTLPANLAVAISADPEKVTYARYKLATPMGAVTHVILAESRAEAYGFTEKTDSLANKDLLGLFYAPLFSCYDDAERKAEKAFRVLDGSSFVSSTDGTGLVHMAPAFGEDDFFACQQAGIRLVDPTDMQACYIPHELGPDAVLAAAVDGKNVKDKETDKAIIKLLKDRNRLLKQDVLVHAYPFCERSDTPLIYKAISSWFVKVEAIKDRMIANNQQIHWTPGHIKDGRFGKWLENARDWCISRNRFWGTPIPVWKCSSCTHVQVVGSRAELDKLLGSHLNDLHMHFIDEHAADCVKCGTKASMHRTPEVLDCWFESGSMPYAQEHYPFENKAAFEASFPADFIAEGIDQTRGWFYTLTVLSTALFDKPAFKNCIVNGMVLAEDGKKMSKRLRNYPDPAEMFSKYGADALRLYLLQSPAVYGEELRFSEKNLVELMRAVMIPLWNAYSFFASYANIDGWKPESKAPSALTSLDRWIIARAKETEKAIHVCMEDYRLSDVAPLFIGFVDDLTNWYIRLNRERFWSETGAAPSADKQAAYVSLWSSLDALSYMLAPNLPFMAETLHAALRGLNLNDLKPQTESIHEKLFRDVKSLELGKEDAELLARVAVAKKIIVLGRSLRGEAKIGLRQPLSKLRVAGLSAEQAENLESLRELVLKEVNVKSLELVAKASDLVEESVKPNHRVLGKKVGGAMKDIQAALAKWTSKEIAAFEASGSAELLGFALGADDIQVVRKALPGRFALAGHGVVAELDTTLTPDLVFEGLQREIVNRIQQRRKETKLHLADRIVVKWAAPKGSLVEKVLLAEAAGDGLIAGETLAVRITAEAVDAEEESFDAHGSLKFEITKA